MNILFKLLLNGYTLAYTHSNREAKHYQELVPCLEIEPFSTHDLPTDICHTSEIPCPVWLCLENALR